MAYSLSSRYEYGCATSVKCVDVLRVCIDEFILVFIEKFLEHIFLQILCISISATTAWCCILRTYRKRYNTTLQSWQWRYGAGPAFSLTLNTPQSGRNMVWYAILHAYIIYPVITHFQRPLFVQISRTTPGNTAIYPQMQDREARVTPA